MKYFLDIIVHLVCRKMCSKNFGNRLIYKKVRVKKKLNRDFVYKKSHEGKYFPAKMENSWFFIMIAQNHYKMTQMTYLKKKI